MAISYLKLFIAALMTVVGTAFFYMLIKHTKFAKRSKMYQQIVIGIVFGCISIIGTEWGIPLNGVMLNCRDAAPLTAGLLFGGPAGIIAGLIGGIERWVAVAWGAGTVTRVACSVSTIVAGIYAALLRRYLFDSKRPTWIICLASGVVMEVFHLTMVFLTNMSTPDKAAMIVGRCISMVAFTGLSVMLSAITLSIMAGDVRARGKRHRITDSIQRELLMCVILAFVLTNFFFNVLQYKLASRQSLTVMSTAMSDVHSALTIDYENISNIAANRHIGKSGYLIIADKNGDVISAPKENTITSINDINLDGEADKYGIHNLIIDGEDYLSTSKKWGSYTIVALYPEEEALRSQYVFMFVNAFMEVLVFAALFGWIYLLIKKIVLNNLYTVNNSLAKIASGNLDEVVNVRSNEEFASLSDDINATVNTLKNYIAEASARIDRELEFAHNIQISVLPDVDTSTIVERKEFAISAQMNAAKEVGGDFYDFYITNGDILNFIIADVSGKGIPAAMFMMRAKTELKSLAERGLPINEVFINGNNHLCEGNDADMFVTSWMGQLNLATGVIEYANAGHNPPLVRHKDGSFEYLVSKAGLVLAAMEDMQYKRQELKLEPGDVIFIYTDGVTEATNDNNELYGEERLKLCLNNATSDDPDELCRLVKADVDDFVGDAPQFDDLTMLALRFDGKPQNNEIKFDNVSIDDIPVATEFVENELDKMDCPMKAKIQISVAIDEILSNIVKFAYGESSGPATVGIKQSDDAQGAVIYFIDDGVPYNPVKKEDPNVTLSAQERKIGGLGIYMVKKSMDDMSYTYKNDQNILQLFKKFE